MGIDADILGADGWHAALAALEWQVELGVSEIVGEGLLGLRGSSIYSRVRARPRLDEAKPRIFTSPRRPAMGKGKAGALFAIDVGRSRIRSRERAIAYTHSGGTPSQTRPFKQGAVRDWCWRSIVSQIAASADECGWG